MCYDCCPSVKRTVLTLLFVFAALSARAVILFRTGDPLANTTAPSNDPAGSGWNYEGGFGGNLGTPIAPHFFASAAHIGGNPGDPFSFGGNTYTTVASFRDPFSDLIIWQVAETFPTFAPLYSKDDERDKHLIVIGRGTQRGNPIFLNSQLRGWEWGGGGPQRWGENIVAEMPSSYVAGGPNDDLYATFDENGLPEEAHLSSGDSGGGVFIQDNGVWKLAGLNHGVDGYFYTDSNGGGQFIGAMFDLTGYYYSDEQTPPHYLQITGTPPTPSGFYATRVSSKLAWINSILDPTGDENNDGISNLLEYARQLNAVPPRGYGEPKAGIEGNNLTITYRKINNASNLQYQVWQSTDLVNWTNAAAQTDVMSTSVNVDIVKAKVAIGNNTTLFLRLKVTEADPSNPSVRSTSRRAFYKSGIAR